MNMLVCHLAFRWIEAFRFLMMHEDQTLPKRRQLQKSKDDIKNEFSLYKDTEEWRFQYVEKGKSLKTSSAVSLVRQVNTRVLVIKITAKENKQKEYQ